MTNYDYYETKTGCRFYRNELNTDLEVTLELNELQEFQEWIVMQRPYQVNDVVEIVIGYHSKRDAIIKGIDGNILWLRVYKHDTGFEASWVYEHVGSGTVRLKKGPPKWQAD